MLSLQESIRTSADLRNHYSDISKLCREGREAVIITVNGRGDTVSLGYEKYCKIKSKSKLELLETLSEAEDDVSNNRVGKIKETFSDIKKMLLEKKRANIPY